MDEIKSDPPKGSQKTAAKPLTMTASELGARPGLDISEIKTLSDVFQKINIALDSYDDIFSDFDPSPYETRLVSEDLLEELTRRYSETRKKEFIVNFTVPRALRSEKTEVLIRKRLKEHFKNRTKEIERRVREKIRGGAIRVLVGLAILLAVALFPQLDVLPFITILSILIWYSLWTGFEYIFDASERLNRKRKFAERFHRAEYHFISEEDVLSSMKRLQDTTPSKSS